jgi:hypothetical protein
MVELKEILVAGRHDLRYQRMLILSYVLPFGVEGDQIHRGIVTSCYCSHIRDVSGTNNLFILVRIVGIDPIADR